MFTNKMRTFLILLILSFTLAGCGTLSKENQQKALKSFQTKLEKVEQPVTNAERSLQDALAQFNGSDTSALSTALTKLKGASAVAEDKLPSVPSGFPDEVDTLLNDEVNNLELAFHSEFDGSENFSHYLDSQNPSDLQKYKDKMADAKEQIAQATSDLDQAKEKVDKN